MGDKKKAFKQRTVATNSVRKGPTKSFILKIEHPDFLLQDPRDH